MKWVTLISLVILISFAQCLDLRRQKREANTICQYYTALKEEGFKAIVLVGLAQNLPKSTFEELVPLIRQSTSAAQGCCGDSPSADCSKDEKELFQGVVCSSQEVVTKNELADCCAKQGEERTKCFIEHKKKIPRDLSLMHHLPASEKCEEFEKDHIGYMGHFIFRFSKRNVLLQPQVILGIADGYEKTLTECCKAADAKHCLDAKKAALQRVIEDRITELKSICVIYQKYGLRILKAKKLVQYSQKLPQATFEEVVDMTDRIAAMTATCCSGDMIQCMKQRKELVDTVCSRDDTLTRTKHLAECCKASVIDRGACIERMKADDKPKDLSAKVESFIKDKDICQKYKADHDAFLGRFIYEYSRRHQELSIQMILRIGKAYEEILKKCCETDDPPACYGSADADLAKAIHENLQHFKGMCEIEKQKGEDTFEKLMLVQYTKIMPQAPFEGLNVVAHRIGDVIDFCCKSKDLDHTLMPCAEERLTNVIDQTCSETDPATVNPHIDQCCKESYSARRPCILKIQPDQEFKPPALTDDSFPIGAALCDMKPHDLFGAAKRLLYTLVRMKTTITNDQLQTISKHFYDIKDKCCAEADKAACFAIEKPKLVAESQALLQA